MNIRPIPETAGWQAPFALLVELRPHLSFDTFVERCRAAQAADAYTLYGAYDEERLVGVMGIRTLTDLLHGRHLYIDDLVVAPAVRSQGVGRRLLQYAEHLAAEGGGVGLRLCTGIDYEPAKRFYVREGWSARAVAFKKLFPA
jgi:GNAT superfamily N-acetyltransferase